MRHGYHVQISLVISLTQFTARLRSDLTEIPSQASLLIVHSHMQVVHAVRSQSHARSLTMLHRRRQTAIAQGFDLVVLPLSPNIFSAIITP